MNPADGYDQDVLEAFERHRVEQGKIFGMPGLMARPAFAAGWKAAKDACNAAILLEREACAKIADAGAELVTKAGRQHPEDSPSRDRCFARAREAIGIAMEIRFRK